ncbi:hypothetical protein HMPREF3224_02172, partial [Anaerococcus hydrogenalis]
CACKLWFETIFTLRNCNSHHLYDNGIIWIGNINIAQRQNYSAGLMAEASTV